MPASVENLSSLISTLVQQPPLVKIAITLLILLAGYLSGQLVINAFRSFYNRRQKNGIVEKVKERAKRPEKYIEYLVSVLTIAVALIYLNSSATNQLFTDILNYLPSILTAALIFILGFLIIKILMDFISGFVETFGVRKYARDLGFSPKLIKMFFKGLRIFLYLVALEIAITQIGVPRSIIGNTLTAASYGLVGLLVVLAFFGFKDLIQNYAAGIYLKSSDVVKPGKNIKLDDESGEVREVSTFGTTIATDSGYFMLSPNQNLMDKNILFKRVEADIETLEDIKSYFVAQDPSYCGPASAEMILAMFGFDLTQREIASKAGTVVGEGTEPDDLIQAVEQLTDGEVRGAFIEYQKITDIADEFKTWFNDGAMIIPNFAKPVLFPNADTGHYTLSVGVEGDELLIVDPSTHTSSGGVYYVDSAEMLEAMSEWRGEERGYIVLAPKGTTAYWRIKEDLIYADRNYYEELSKTLEVRLKKIMRKGRILRQVMPDATKDFLDRWRSDEKVKRLWKPDGDLREGERKLDEFTDSDE